MTAFPPDDELHAMVRTTVPNQERYDAYYERLRKCEAAAAAMYEQHGYEKCAALVGRLYRTNPHVAAAIEFGALVDEDEGSVLACNQQAADLLRDWSFQSPRFDLAVMWRFIAYTMERTGVGRTGSDMADSLARGVLTFFNVAEIPLPDEAAWDAANVDATMEQAATRVEWEMAGGDPADLDGDG